MTNPSKNDAPDKALVERLQKVRDGFCSQCCPHGTEQNWAHDPACQTMAEAIAVLSQPQHGGLVEALRKIAAFGDPYEIADNPEEFGGTDDGCETVCMAYENMQSIASAALGEKG